MDSSAQHNRLICPECNGAGCGVCHRIGQTERLGGRWAYWGTPVHAGTILGRRIERHAHALVDVALFLFGLLGAASCVWWLQEQGIFSLGTDAVVLPRMGDSRLFLFGLSALTDLYLVFRVVRTTQRQGTIPRDDALKTQQRQPATVGAVQALPDHDRINIAGTLSAEAYHAVEEAWELARRFQAPRLEAIFLFAATLMFRSVGTLRTRLELSDQQLLTRIQHLLQRTHESHPTSPELGAQFTALMLSAYRRAVQRRSPQVTTIELFAASTEQDDVRDLLDELGVTPSMLKNAVHWLTIREDLRRRLRHVRSRAQFKPRGAMNRALTAVATPYLDRFSHDLTALQRSGARFPCIGRERELEHIFRIFESGRHVLLVGDAGVGKRTLVDGIAERMVTEEVPELLKDKRLVRVSVAALLGASASVGGIEGRLTRLLTEAARAGNIVLFIEDVQNMVGVGSAGGAAFDLSSILANVAAGGRFPIVAACTSEDYRRFLEPVPAMRDTFSVLPVAEVSLDDAIKILEIRSGAVEYQQRVFFSYGAIAKIVALADRYIHDRALPEKAVQLLEDVGVAVRKERGERSIVTGSDVARIAADKLRLPLTEVTEEEGAKLLHLEERFHERIVGQDEAVRAVAAALRRARTELRDPNRPIANFLFLGPTGVGKTELAKTVARVYFGAEKNMIRLDMSEYQEPQSLTQLIGAPAGFSGGGTGGYLTEAIRRQPYALLLLDELEKAHADILNIFLQVMDDGRLTDTAGRTIDCSNIIIIATSNAGTQAITDGLARGQSMDVIRQTLVERELQQYFRPEFLNRFDQIVVFTPLSRTEIVAVTKLLLGEVAGRLAEKHITLEASEAAIRELADEGYDPLFGARPLRRLIQEKVDNALAQYLLTGKLNRRDRAVLEPGGRIRVIQAPSILQR